MKAFLIKFLILILVMTAMPAANVVSKENNNYGVFTSINSSQIKKLLSYKQVVIDASAFSKADIDVLHKNGVKVFSYLNIGSIESFRPYYNEYKNLTLKDYDNWEDERWMDVSSEMWQNFIVNDAAKKLSSKGIDGFFIDNVDVYGIFNNDETFNGIYTILCNLNAQYNKTIIVNGGYDFITTAFTRQLPIDKIIQGVNNESVFSSVTNYENNLFSKNNKADRLFTLDYLDSLKAKGLDIYIIEYSRNKKLINQMTKYYSQRDFNAYISNNLSLK